MRPYPRDKRLVFWLPDHIRVPIDLLTDGSLSHALRQRFGPRTLTEIDWDLDSGTVDGVTTGYGKWRSFDGNVYDAVAKVALSPMTYQSLMDLCSPPPGSGWLAYLGGIKDVVHGGIVSLSREEAGPVFPYHIAAMIYSHIPRSRDEIGSDTGVKRLDILLPESQETIHVCQAVSEELLMRLAEYPDQRFLLRPRLFEQTVAELLRRMGHEVTLTPYSGDQGRDVIALIKIPAVAPLLLLVECKRYAPHRLVGPEPIARLWCRLFEDKANLGMIVTTSSFQPVARHEASLKGHQICLKDGFAFIDWIQTVLRGESNIRTLGSWPSPDL